MDLIRALSSVARNRTTYRVGLLQAKAFRILKETTGEFLEPHGISTTEWAFLGLIYDRDSIRPKEAAQELGVEPPFVTVMFSKLSDKNLITELADPADSRAKLLSLTEAGKRFVATVEKGLRTHMQKVLKGAKPAELVGYLQILERIIANASVDNKA
jgi:DNA-binding MarR family transcriptional regulator